RWVGVLGGSEVRGRVGQRPREDPAGARGAGIWITVRGVEARALGRVVDVQEDGLIGRGAGGPGRRSHDVAQPAVETDVAGVAVGSIERELRRLGRILPTGSVVAHSSDDDAVDG